MEQLNYINDNFFLQDGDLWKFGQAQHRVAKCRIDRCVEHLQNQKTPIEESPFRNISNERLKFVLLHGYIPDIVMLNDDQDLVDISYKLWCLYRDKDKMFHKTRKVSYLATLNDSKGVRQRRSFSSRDEAVEWTNIHKEQYRKEFDDLGLLSYFS